MQTICLGIALLFFSLNKNNNNASNDIFLFSSIISVCTSRLGLWVFDITVTQIQQEEISEEFRCVVGGVQEALNAFFTIISFGMGLLCPHPDDFVYISISGFVSVMVALLFFFGGIYLPRELVSRSRLEQNFETQNIEHRTWA